MSTTPSASEPAQVRSRGGNVSANKYVCVVVRDRDYGLAHTVCQRRLTGHGSHGTETAHRSREPGRCFLFEIGPCTWESCGAQLFQLTNTHAQLQGGSGVTTAGHGRAVGTAGHGRGSQGALGLPPPLVSPPRSTGVWETSEAVSLGAYNMYLLDLVGARAHGF